jgi:double-stranded uracil-DNA glycosylase
VVAPRLAILFCGINPGLYSGAVGHHFARPGNRFWKALHAGGFTARVLSPFEERDLLQLGIGVTNLINRATAGADELSAEELRQGAEALERKVCRLQPTVVAFLGLTAYRTAFGRQAARIGPQPELLCAARIWLLPNPSGRTAHYQLGDLAEAFSRLRRATTRPSPRRRRPGPGREGRR